MDRTTWAVGARADLALRGRQALGFVTASATIGVLVAGWRLPVVWIWAPVSRAT